MSGASSADFFEDIYLAHYTPLQTEAETEREAELLAEELPGRRILDVCCGHGRHSRALAKAGRLVTGVDLSPAALARAQALARGQPGLSWVRADMRALPFAGGFDGCLIWFSAIAVVDDDAQALAVLQGVRRALRPGGRLVIQTIDHGWLMANFKARAWFPLPGGGRVVETRRWDALAGVNHIEIRSERPDGSQLVSIHRMRIFTVVELARLLAAAGLPVTAVWGGVDRAPHALGSRWTIVSAGG